MEAHLLVDGRPFGVLLGRRRSCRTCNRLSPVGGNTTWAGCGPALGHGRHARDDGDGELESLGAVDGHDSHGIVVALGQDGLGHPRTFGRLQVHPAQVLAQIASGGLAPRPGLVDDETQSPPHVAGPPFGEAELHGPPVGRDPVEQLRRGQPVRAGRRATAGRPEPARTGSSAGTVSGWSARIAPPSLAASTLKRKRSSSPQASSGVRRAETMRR